MNIVKYLFFPFVLLGLVLSSCEEEQLQVDSRALDTIYPIAIGEARMYYILDSTFDVSGPLVEEYIKRERVVGTTTDLEGRTVYQIQVDRRDLDETSFRLSHRWNLWIPPAPEVGTFIEQQEQNIRYIRMGYPVNRVNQWDGNKYNTLDTRIFSYLSIDTMITIGTKTYDNCIFVQEGSNQNSAIQQAEAYSIYQPGRGHILRYDRIMVFDGPNREFNPDRSRIYREELLSN